MNNLKRILSLALASVMVLGMMVVSASAFEDDKLIENKTAAEVMNALGIIKGREDGNFDPKAPVKRSEMAKMITVALTGNPDFNIGLAGKGTFPDVPENHWAAEYIEYCASLGIISGRTDGKYYPDDNVTGQEAAKMMLAALGYEPEIFGFATGAKWATIVDGYASALPTGELPEGEDPKTYEFPTVSLYDNVAGARALPLTRDDAAQLIYNGLKAHTVTSKVVGIQAGAPAYEYNMHNKTLLEKTFKADVNAAVTLESIKYNAKTGVYTYNESGTAITSAIDVSDYFQQKIQTVTQGEKILAIMGTNSVVGTGFIGGADFDAKKLTIDGKALATTEEGAIATKVYTYNSTEIAGGVVKGGTEAAPTLGWKTDDGLKVWYNYSLIAAGGKVTTIVVYPTSVEKVTEVKDGKINAYVVEATKPEDVTATTKDELAKGDYMLVSAAPNMLTKLEKLDVLANQTATAYDVEKDLYTIGGKDYELAGSAAINTTPGETTGLGKAYDLVLVNGYVMVAASEEAPAPDALDLSKVLYVQQVGAIVDGPVNAMGKPTGSTLKVRAVFTDGTSTIIDVANIGVKGGEGDDKNDPKPVSNDESAPNLATVDTLYSFTEKDGKYNLMPLGEEKLGFTTVSDTVTMVYTIGGKEYTLAGDATINPTTGLGKAYGLVIVNGYVLAADNGQGTTSNEINLGDILYVTEVGAVVASGTNDLGQGTGKVQKVRVVFTDGTSDVINVSKLGGSAITDTQDAEVMLADGDEGLYAFVPKSGKYELTKLVSTPSVGEGDEATDPVNMLGFTGLKEDVTSITAGGKSGTIRFATDAVLFVEHLNAKGEAVVEIMKGADINGWKNTATVVSTLYTKYNATSGLETVGFGVISVQDAEGQVDYLPGEEPTDPNNYGYLVSNPINVYNPDAKATQKQVKVWNGAETVTYFVNLAEGEFTNAAGDIIKFSTQGNVIVAVDGDVATAKCITAFDGTIFYFAEDDSHSLNDAKAVIYIDDAKKTGAATGTIRRNADDKNNVYYVATDDGKFVLFVDVNNVVTDQGETEEENPCANGHTPSSNPTQYVQGTGANEGKHAVKCANCDAAAGEYADHTAPENVTEGSGTHTYICEDCGESVTEDCDTEGEDNACSVCGYKAD